ncbi:tyrosine-type recombinase/integrase [Amycolatopsis sp. cg9]|uniref:tyrosine-type recombinase/integrase n=1 Tax=Amycolatopsis sp. cg9 TaxID=3238801 RepID=UPI0035259A0C
MTTPTTTARSATLVTGTDRLLSAALDAAGRGWPVFPLAPRSKRPAIPEWQQRATCDPDRIVRWWTRHPTHNLLTGLTNDTPSHVARARWLTGRTPGSLDSGGFMELNQPMRADACPKTLPRWGRVEAVDGVVPWLVVDDHGNPVEPIRRFLLDFVASGYSRGSVRSYSYGLLRWWRWLLVDDVAWDRATSNEVRGLVLWMLSADKPRRAGRTESTATVGTVNVITRKQHLNDGYQPRTIRHSNAVIRSFYEFWLDLGEPGGPLINPVPLRGKRGARANEHHNPLQPWRAEGQLRYNPSVPKRKPRAMSDQQWFDLFGALRSNRDRAILAVAVSSAARAAELLGVRPADLDWGGQLVRVIRKGTAAEQWLPASAEAFVWIRCYLADLGQPLEPSDRLWQTLRRRDYGAGQARQPLNYEALRAVLRRVNALLGSNWSMHDLRHTAALRMSRDESLSMRDVQIILGHAHLSTTADIYLVEDEAEIVQRVHEHFARRSKQPHHPAPPAAAGYDEHDLAVLFGRTAR